MKQQKNKHNLVVLQEERFEADQSSEMSFHTPIKISVKQQKNKPEEQSIYWRVLWRSALGLRCQPPKPQGIGKNSMNIIAMKSLRIVHILLALRFRTSRSLPAEGVVS